VILIHQMAKVASRSWVEAARPAAAKEGSTPFHCHHVVPCNRERIEAIFRLTGPRQTIANMYFPRYLQRSSASAWNEMELARQRREQIRVVAGMRDPVARSISLMVFLCDFFGHVSRPLSPRVALSTEYVIGALQENWKWVLERSEPKESFEWVLWYLTDAYRTWFSSELGAAFGVDVLKGTFQRPEAMQRISTSLADILIYRVEDMLPEALGYPRLLAQASTLLETPLTSLPNVNTSSTRRSRELSAEMRRRFWLPADMIDAIYGEPVVQHFYDRDEILAFKKLWSAPRG
jgi:hypothetical protein